MVSSFRKLLFASATLSLCLAQHVRADAFIDRVYHGLGRRIIVRCMVAEPDPPDVVIGGGEILCLDFSQADKSDASLLIDKQTFNQHGLDYVLRNCRGMVPGDACVADLSGYISNGIDNRYVVKNGVPHWINPVK